MKKHVVHGATFGATTVTDIYRGALGGAIALQISLPTPTLEKTIALETTLKQGGTFKVTIEREENEDDGSNNPAT